MQIYNPCITEPHVLTATKKQKLLQAAHNIFSNFQIYKIYHLGDRPNFALKKEFILKFCRIDVQFPFTPTSKLSLNQHPGSFPSCTTEK